MEETVRAAYNDWLQGNPRFSDDDPSHALRCAAHALHDAGIISDATHLEVCLALFV
jgi:hypothetical protein